MVNIWEFLLQTISVSLVAGLIIIVKNIFKDKLTSRWQYGIWILLVLRIFIPVKANKLVLLPFGIYLGMLKTYVESNLGSAYTHPLTATESSSVIPYISSAPKSITDILFIIYFFGVIAFLCFYLFSYIKLRLVLKKGDDISSEKRLELQHILSENKIKNIKIVSVEGISSAFICGVFSPILVLPSERETDEKILFHEIMHLKHLDSLQNILWCFLRCLHWCNPFMHYIFNIVGNDMEMLCDLRVLEKLDGEERRDYGVLLLNEVNKKYARMPGTTSVSNGGKNISRRIEAIVRFKKYPKGMALVSICIAIILSLPCLFVSAGFSAYSNIYIPQNEYEFQKALAHTKINRCATIAGAIDTYAKALVDHNGIILLTASPVEKHQEIINNLYGFHFIDNNIDFYATEGRPFSVFNLTKIEDEKYSAILVFSIYEEDVEGYSKEEEYGFGDTLFVPIEIFKENNFWVVRETGERKKSKSYLDESPLVQINCLEEDAPILFEDIMQGENGTLWVKTSSVYTIDYSTSDSQNITFTSGVNYDSNVNLNRDFSDCLIETNYIYTYEGDDYKEVSHVSIEYTADTDAEFEAEGGSSLNFFSSSTDGSGRSSYSVNSNSKWDRTLQVNDTNSNCDYKKLMEGYNSTRKLAVYVDGKLVDTFTVEVNTNGN